MTQYLTTGEDLTNIANAIRAASGENSSLVYPTGFVSKIGELSKWNPYGPHKELIWTSNVIEHTFAETTLSSWTPTSTATTIFDVTTCTPNQLYLDATKYYVVETLGWYDLKYTETPSKAHIKEGYFVGCTSFGRHNNSPSNFINDIYDYVTYNNFGQMITNLYHTSSGGYSITHNSYGMYFNHNSPSFSNSYNDEFGCNLRTPILRVTAADTYMHSSSFSLLNLNTSKFYMIVNLYSATKNPQRYFLEVSKQLYDLNHNET